jgi:N-methylhydantoinase B
VRVCTTGGGGWGDPLEREPLSVLQDVNDDKVSAQAARTDYGVVLRKDGLSFEIDLAATQALRDELRQKQIERAPMIDRGPGYLELLR